MSCLRLVYRALHTHTKFLLVTSRVDQSNISKGIHTAQIASAKKVAKAAGKAGAVLQKKEMEVETDPEKLLKYCCGANYLKEGTDPELKPDSEYPDWLWTLRTERDPIPLEELEKNTVQYWRRVRRIHLQRNARLRKFRQLN